MSDLHFYSHGRLSGIGRRMAALAVDTVVVAVFVVPVGYAIQRLLRDVWFKGVDWLSASSVAMLLYLAYFTLLGGRGGATVGKWLLGLRVQDAHGGPCTMRASLIRNVMRVVDGFPFFFAPGVPPLYLIGGVMMLYTPRRQRLGDWAAETVVVLATAPQPVSAQATPRREQAKRGSGRKRRRA